MDENRSKHLSCCGIMMDDEVASCPCWSVMRRHPVVMSTVLALMGLACLLIPAAAILGFIAFFRTM